MLDYLKMGNVTINIKIHDPVTIKDFGDRKKLSAYCEDTILANLMDTLHSNPLWKINHFLYQWVLNY